MTERTDRSRQRREDRTLTVSQEARERMAHELHEGERIERAITILRSPSEVFSFWRDFTNLPKFMSHLESIELLSPMRTHWVWRTKGGLRLEWETELIAEIQNRMLSWQTVPGSGLMQAGSVWFRPAPQDRATEIHVQLMYRIPGGKIAQAVAKTISELAGEDPAQTLQEDLRRLKRLMETGEIPSTEGQPKGSSGILH